MNAVIKQTLDLIASLPSNQVIDEIKTFDQLLERKIQFLRGTCPIDEFGSVHVPESLFLSEKEKRSLPEFIQLHQNGLYTLV